VYHPYRINVSAGSATSPGTVDLDQAVALEGLEADHGLADMEPDPAPVFPGAVRGNRVCQYGAGLNPGHPDHGFQERAFFQFQHIIDTWEEVIANVVANR
jgi:hypothetical protein